MNNEILYVLQRNLEIATYGQVLKYLYTNFPDEEIDALVIVKLLRPKKRGKIC